MIFFYFTTISSWFSCFFGKVMAMKSHFCKLTNGQIHFGISHIRYLKHERLFCSWLILVWVWTLILAIKMLSIQRALIAFIRHPSFKRHGWFIFHFDDGPTLKYNTFRQRLLFVIFLWLVYANNKSIRHKGWLSKSQKKWFDEKLARSDERIMDIDIG